MERENRIRKQAPESRPVDSWKFLETMVGGYVRPEQPKPSSEEEKEGSDQSLRQSSKFPADETVYPLVDPESGKEL